MDYRLERQLHTQHNKQKLSFWASVAKNVLQLTLLAALLVGITLYYAQVVGLRFVYSHDGELKGMQFVKGGEDGDGEVTVFEREKCAETLVARDKAREEAVSLRGDLLAVEESLKHSKMRSKQLEKQNTRLLEEMKKRSSDGQQRMALSEELMMLTKTLEAAEMEQNRTQTQLLNMRRDYNKVKASETNLEVQMAQLRQELGEREQEKERQLATREAELAGEVASLKERSRASEESCETQTSKLEQDLQELIQATSKHVAMVDTLQAELKEAKAAKEVAEEEMSLASAERDEVVAKNLQLSPKVQKLESTVDFLTSQSCPVCECTNNATTAGDVSNGPASLDDDLAQQQPMLPPPSAPELASNRKAYREQVVVPGQAGLLSLSQLEAGMSHWAGGGARMRRFLNKMRTGQKLTVAAVGRGMHLSNPVPPEQWYTTRLHSWLNQAFPLPAGQHKVHYGGVASSARASRGSSMWYMAQCLAMHVPSNTDLVIVEYTAQSAKGITNRSVNLQQYERLIRKTLALPSRPAVILLHASTWRTHPFASPLFFLGPPEDEYDTLAKYYQLPALSLRDAIFHEVIKGMPGFKPSDFCSMCKEEPAGSGVQFCQDINALGHQYLAELLVHRLSSWSHLNQQQQEEEWSASSSKCVDYPRELQLPALGHTYATLSPAAPAAPTKDISPKASPNIAKSAKDSKPAQAETAKAVKKTDAKESSSSGTNSKESSRAGVAKASSSSSSPKVTRSSSSSSSSPSISARTSTSPAKSSSSTSSRRRPISLFSATGRRLLQASEFTACELAIPPPVFPNNWGSSTISKCFQSSHFKNVVKQNAGWEFTEKGGTTQDLASGWTSSKARASIQFQLDTVLQGGLSNDRVPVMLSYIHATTSAKATVKCEGCACQASATVEKTTSGFVLNAEGKGVPKIGGITLLASQSASCVLHVTNMDGKRFKLTSIIVSDYASTLD